MEILKDRSFQLVTASNFFFHLTFTAFFLLPLYVQSLGGDEAEIGIIMGSFGLTSMFLIPLVGNLLDRYGRKPFLLLGCILMAVVSLAFGLIRDYDPFLFGALRALQGASFSCAFIAANALIVDFAEPSERARAIGYFGVFTLVTHAIGPIIGEVLHGVIGYRYGFLISTGWSLVGLLFVFPLREPDRPAEARGGGHPPRESIGMRLRTPLATALLTGASFVAVLIFVPVLMETRGLRPVSTFFIGYTAAATAMRLFCGGLSDRWGRRPTISLFLTVFCLSTLVLTFAPKMERGLWPLIIFVSLAFGASHGMLYPTLSALVVDMMQENQKGRAVAYYSGAFNVGATLAAFALGPVLKAYGYTIMFVCSTAAALLALLVFHIPTTVPGAKRADGT